MADEPPKMLSSAEVAERVIRDSVAFLLAKRGDLPVIELLGEIRETVLANAKERTIG